MQNQRKNFIKKATAFAVSCAVLCGAGASQGVERGSEKPSEGTKATLPDLSLPSINPLVISAATGTTGAVITSKTTVAVTTTTVETTTTVPEMTTAAIEPEHSEPDYTEPDYTEPVYIESDYFESEYTEPDIQTEQYYDDYSAIVYDIPNDGYCNSNWKPYMGYQAVTVVGSAQYQLLNSCYAYTDENGMRCYDDGTGKRYCIAIGSYYGAVIGQKIDLIMNNGYVIPCILGDAKADCHTNWSHQYGAFHGDVAEFIIDNTVFYNYCDGSGTVNWVDGLDGGISQLVVYQ